MLRQNADGELLLGQSRGWQRRISYFFRVLVAARAIRVFVMAIVMGSAQMGFENPDIEYMLKYRISYGPLTSYNTRKCPK